MVGIQQGVDGRVGVRQDDGRVHQPGVHSAGAAEGLDGIDGVQGKPTEHEE